MPLSFKRLYQEYNSQIQYISNQTPQGIMHHVIKFCEAFFEGELEHLDGDGDTQGEGQSPYPVHVCI